MHSALVLEAAQSASVAVFSLWTAKKNASTTALRLTTGSGKGLGVQEDGRISGRVDGSGPGRRSYEASGSSNRSMTNLGLTGRR